MGVYTNIEFRNANDPKYLAAKNGTPEEREEWEDIEGSFEDRPGAKIESDESRIVQETDDEYGGWIIAVADIPKDATHIVIHRG